MTDRKIGDIVDEPVRIVIDGAYIRDQARDAMHAFIAPLKGVYVAATGTKSDRSFGDDPKRKKQA